jgi:hypothetical protein
MFAKTVVGKTLQEGRFPNSRISNQEDFKEEIIVVAHFLFLVILRMKRKIDETFVSIFEDVCEIKAKLRDLQSECDRETQYPLQLLSFLSGKNLLRVHGSFQSSSLREEKTLVSKLETQIYKLFPHTSLELDSLPMVSLHGICKVQGVLGFVYPSSDIQPQLEAPLLEDGLLAREELEQMPFRSVSMQGQVSLEIQTSECRLYWKKPLAQRNPTETAQAELLKKSIQLWDIKLDREELSQIVERLSHHYAKHPPPIETIEQRQERTMTFPCRKELLFSYFIFLGEAGQPKYRLSFLRDLQHTKEKIYSSS